MIDVCSKLALIFLLTSASTANGTVLLIQLEAATYSDNGRYVCKATIRETDSDNVQTISTSFYVNIQGQTPLYECASTCIHYGIARPPMHAWE